MRREARAAAPTASADGRDRYFLVLGTAALFGGQLALSLLRSGRVLVADETRYLTNARVLIDAVPGLLERAPLYRAATRCSYHYF